MLQMLNDGQQCALLVVRRTRVREHRVRVAADEAANLQRQARLADSGFAADRDSTARAIANLPPKLLSCSISSSRPTRSLSSSAGPQRFETALAPPPLCRRSTPDGHFETFQRMQTEIDVSRTSRRRGASSRPRSRRCRGASDTLQPAREVRSFADDGLLREAPCPIRSPTTTLPVAIPTRTSAGAVVGERAWPLRLADLFPARTAFSGSFSLASGIAEIHE